MAHLTSIIMALWSELRTPYGFMRFRTLLCASVFFWTAAVGALFYIYGE